MRLAAYAHLLAVSEGGQTPFAIVLFAGTAEGIAMPITVAGLESVRDKLEEFRLCLDSGARGIRSAVPADVRICSGCPFGCPRPAGERDRRDVKLGRRLHLVAGPDGKSYHSECGDRFGWTPPHEDAIDKRIV